MTQVVECLPSKWLSEQMNEVLGKSEGDVTSLGGPRKAVHIGEGLGRQCTLSRALGIG
jgi:hypothetical protein